MATLDDTESEAKSTGCLKTSDNPWFDFGLHAMMRRTALLFIGEEQCPARLTLQN
jgi:hypothetical protein